MNGYVTGATRNGRRLLIRADAVEFAIETVHKGPDRMVARRRVAGSETREVHVVLSSGEQGDMAIGWDEFVARLVAAQQEIAVAEGEEPGRPGEQSRREMGHVQ